MWWFVFKTIASGILIATVSEIAKRTPQWAAFLTALPLLTILSIMWIYYEQRDLQLLSVYVYDVLIWTIPGISFFLIAIPMFRHDISFWITLPVSLATLAAGTMLCVKFGLIKA